MFKQFLTAKGRTMQLQLVDPRMSPEFATAKNLQATGPPLEELKLTQITSQQDVVFNRERDRFFRMKQQLLSNQAYLNKYVAVINGNVADSDNDKSALVERVYSRFGYIPLYIGKVTNEQKRSVRLPSPRRLR